MSAINFYEPLTSHVHFARDHIIPPPRVRPPEFSTVMISFLDQIGLTATCQHYPFQANQLSGCLAAPRTLLHLLDYLGQNPRRAMNVLYLGAGVYESFDQGRWFSLYHKLHPRAPKPALTLVGPDLVELDEVAGSLTPAAQACQLARYAEPCISATHPFTLEEAVERSSKLQSQIDSGYFDLIIMHQPGWGAPNRSWVEDEAVSHVLEAHHDRVVGTAFCATDLVLDTPIMLMRRRFFQRPQVNPEPHQSRYLDHQYPNSRWGHVMWSLTDRHDQAWEPMRDIDPNMLCKVIDTMLSGLDRLSAANLLADRGEGFPGEWLPDNKRMAMAPGWTLDASTRMIRVDTPALQGDIPMPQFPDLDPLEPGIPASLRMGISTALVSLLVNQIALP
jgi:hypothetical protein